MVYPALLPLLLLMRTPRLPVVEWIYHHPPPPRRRRFKWTRPFRGKTKSGFFACAITFHTCCNNWYCETCKVIQKCQGYPPTEWTAEDEIRRIFPFEFTSDFSLEVPFPKNIACRSPVISMLLSSQKVDPPLTSKIALRCYNPPISRTAPKLKRGHF